MADVQIPREAVEAGARSMMRDAYAGDDSQWDKLQPTQQHIVRERALAVLNVAAPFVVAAELDRMKAELERLAAERDAIGDDDYEPDEDDCDDPGDCHRSAALATYVRAQALVSRRAAELRGES